ncbi:MAG: hypothetical protein IT189_03410 [Microbacteriaceae bacterium]|jgi:hypothetical protein|nr:hypothetical protein [Microbacteriaceae bacterium]
MTEPTPDPRPEPRWGQYSDAPPVVAAPETLPPPTVAPQRPPAPTSDVVLTVLLLGIGLVDVIRQFSSFANFASVMRESYIQLGYGEFTSDALANSMGVAQNVVRVLLILIAIVWSARRIRQRKRAFWVPLAAGGAAALVLLVGILALMLIDPALATYLNTLTG